MPEKPLTKEAVADILSVSLRTVANWMADGTLPPWQYIGRRAYWHPDVFNAWLDTRLNPPQPVTPPAANPRSPACQPDPVLPDPAPRKRGRPRRSGR